VNRWIVNLLAVAALSGLLAVGPASAYRVTDMMPQPQVKIELDGYPLHVQPDPILYKGRTLVPFRFVAETLGLQVSFDAMTDSVLAANDKVDIRLRLGERSATVNGQTVPLDVEAMLLQGHTYVPARFLSEAVGAQVAWDAGTSTVRIASQPRDLHTLVFYGLGSYEKRGYLPKFDEVAFTWSRLNAEGKLVFDESEYRWPLEGATELLLDVRNAEIGTALMVFSENASGELTRLLADDRLQAEFIETLTAKLLEQGIESAVLDFETLGKPGDDVEAVQAQYAAFVERVADALHQHGRKLTVVVAPLNGAFKGYDYPALAAHADRLFLMAYSYIDDRFPQPLERIDEAIKLAKREVDPNKLLLGISAFSETPETVGQKIALAKRHHLGGVGFWILKLFDDPFMQGVEQQLILNETAKKNRLS
jgi:hypothetical protein